jgi:methyl-accepting chemotaxis protein
MKLLAKFNLIFLVVFGTGGFLISQLAHSYLIGSARDEVLDQERLMMASARSVRDYTAIEISPLLQENPRHRVRFLPETIPFYGASTTFAKLRKDYPDYTYKEAALNPTNPEDRATGWEVDIIDWLRDHRDEQEKSGQRNTLMGPALYLANPIKTTKECLECHSTPAAAPKAMIAVYGSANGFGWKEGAVVGAQIVSVPLSIPLANADRAYRRLLFFLALTMLVALLALDAGVYWFVIRPLRTVSETADRISRGEKDVPSVKIEGKDEIATVAASFNRMQVSLAKALKMFAEE